ncbi:MAG: ABC transporter ATP-binding protein [Lachnospiraceae bacterium]|nr:ABC transporter ATP-binding protein [Lachnospiraceae bacterium]
MSILSIQDVRYQYKNKYQTVEALKGIDYEFEKSKVYALVGKSGSGKTTLLSLMAGLDLPTKGEILFDGVSTKQMDRDKYRREDATVIYQTFNLLPLLTVLENVMYPMELKGIRKDVAREIAAQAISKVDLDPEVYANRLPVMLSGGERQRIAVARALASDAKVILADEPTGNLDEGNSANVMNLLTRLSHDEGYCVIIVTHDLNLADKADVILRISDGCLSEMESARN